MGHHLSRVLLKEVDGESGLGNSEGAVLGNVQRVTVVGTDKIGP